VATTSFRELSLLVMHVTFDYLTFIEAMLVLVRSVYTALISFTSMQFW